ncbi:MAG: cation:proton antiporter [Thiofilum sp.]|uniref:cation:proton antiporter n=1 Tax=Thiofilum sp. TaxID=2212733 RepID=UPI0025E35A50|nr:cation:proton antiporter [Thiofilum sp.]MBK8454418.1 cation:proton antiporter [Thiofilum sp.]
MLENLLPQLLLLLSTSFIIVVLFQRLHLPSSLAYLLVGLILGEYTPGPVIDDQPVRALAEFGVVFLLFTIGLSFSLPQIYALRHTLLGVGTGQVVFSTVVVAILAWLVGLPAASAFIVGAVFAQSSSTIMSKQLEEQREQNTPYGREGLAISVFQDIMAVPFIVIIPVLSATAASFTALGSALGLALAKAILAFAIVVVIGKLLLRPLFSLVTQQRSSEVFTLSVLFVALAASGVSYALGLSMAFGAFLAGMVLGETEFRHQIESVIRPFKDVLLGLFFIGIGMMVNPKVLPSIWHLALLGALVLLVSKAAIVAAILKLTGKNAFRAWRTGWLVAIGGEFGFALLAIALSARVIDYQTSQIVLTSVLFSMIAAPFVIRYNEPLARLFSGTPKPKALDELPKPVLAPATPVIEVESKQVVLCGYGKRGQSIAQFLQTEQIPFLALDINPHILESTPLAGTQVFYGDASELDMLEALGVQHASLVVVTYDQEDEVLKTLRYIRQLNADVPIMVQTRDESLIKRFREGGATEVIPDNLELDLMLAAHALLLLGVSSEQVLERLKQQWQNDYPLLNPLFNKINI